MTLAQHHEGLGPGRAQSSSGASADGSVGQHGRLLGERDVRVGPTPGPRARGAGKPIHAAAPMHVLPQPCPTQNSHPKRAWLGIQDGARILSSTPPPLLVNSNIKSLANPQKKNQTEEAATKRREKNIPWHELTARSRLFGNDADHPKHAIEKVCNRKLP